MQKPRIKILIADDSRTIRAFIHGALEALDWPIDFIEASTGDGCLEYLLTLRPNVAFIDINMPGASGLQVLEEAREKGLNTFAILMSTEDSTKNVDQGGKLRAHDFLTKPFTEDDVRQEVRNYLRMALVSRILIVDDSAQVRRIVRRVCENSAFNMRIDEAESGEEALKKYQVDRYDIAFVDIEMPGIDGLKTVREIRAVQPQSRIVMISGRSAEDLAKAAREVGVEYTLPKPFFQKDINKIITEVYGLRHTRYEDLDLDANGQGTAAETTMI